MNLKKNSVLQVILADINNISRTLPRWNFFGTEFIVILIENQLNVIDVAASAIAKNNDIAAELFVLGEGEAIKDVILGKETRSTHISNDDEIIFLN